MSIRYGIKPNFLKLAAVTCAAGLLLLMSSNLPLTRSGDEPHYMIVINSIIFDRDLDLRDDYERVRLGGFEAGRRFAGSNLDHHTVIIDTHSGKETLWHNVYDWMKPNDCRAPCEGFERKDPSSPERDDYIERSSHPIGFPLILTALVAPTFPKSPLSVERRAGIVMVLISWLGIVLTYLITLRQTRSHAASFLGSALLAVASPWTAYSRSFFSEPLIGFFHLAALWAILERKVFLAAVALVLASFVKPTTAVVVASWIAVASMARDKGMAFTLVGVCALGALGVLSLNYFLTGSYMRTGTTGWVWITSPLDLPSTFIDPAHGLLVFVPWTIFAWLALLRSLPDLFRKGLRPDIYSWAGLPMLGTLVLLALFYYLGGTCYGPRYWVPFLPWLAVLAAVSFYDASSLIRKAGNRLLFLFAAILGMAVAVPGYLFYESLWDQPFHYPYSRAISLIGRQIIGGEAPIWPGEKEYREYSLDGNSFKLGYCLTSKEEGLIWRECEERAHVFALYGPYVDTATCMDVVLKVSLTGIEGISKATLDISSDYGNHVHLKGRTVIIEEGKSEELEIMAPIKPARRLEGRLSLSGNENAQALIGKAILTLTPRPPDSSYECR